MAASSLLTLIDDIAMLLDDVAVMTKVAARNSAAVADDVAAMTQLAAKKLRGSWAMTWRSTPNKWRA